MMCRACGIGRVTHVVDADPRTVVPVCRWCAPELEVRRRRVVATTLTGARVILSGARARPATLDDFYEMAVVEIMSS